jgi:phosphoribosylformylglycinamidine synthase
MDALAATLFGESATRVIVSVAPADLQAILADAARAGLTATRIGRTGGSSIRISVDGRMAIDCAVAQAEERWSTSLAGWLAA